MIAAISASIRGARAAATNDTPPPAGYAWIKGMPDLNRATRRQIGQAGAGWTFTTICSLLHHVGRVGRPHAKKAARESQRLSVGIAAIADETGHSENKVRRDLGKLRDLGLVAIHHPNVMPVRDPESGRITENRTGRSKATVVFLTIQESHLRARPATASNPSRMEGLPMHDRVHPGGAIQRERNTKRTPDGDADGVGTPPAAAEAGLPAGEAGGHPAAGTGRLAAAGQEGTPILPIHAGRDEPEPDLPQGRLLPAAKAPAARRPAKKAYAGHEQPQRSAAEAAESWKRRNLEMARMRAEYLAARNGKKASSRPPEPPPPAPEPSAPFDMETARQAALAKLKAVSA